MTSELVNKLKSAIGATDTDSKTQSENQTSTQSNTTFDTSTQTSATAASTSNQAAPRTQPPQENRTGPLQHDNAAHVPPSVLAQHVDGPHVMHDFPEDSKTSRHSVSHQEKHMLG